MTIREVRLTSTTSYLPAAATAVYSFLKHNDWFDGTVRVWCPADELADVSAGLARPRIVSVHPVSATLATAVERLMTIAPDPNWARFLSLQTLAEPADHDVLVIDSDLLFQTSIEGLNHVQGDFVACADGPTHNGFGADRRTNAVIRRDRAALQDPGAVIPRTFNSGLLRINGKLLGADLFARAIAILSGSEYAAQLRVQHDQFILNRIFEEQWVEANPSYNFVMKHAATIARKTEHRLSDAKVIHFNTLPRPWELSELLTPLTPELAWAAAQWLTCYAELVATAPLRSMVRT